MAVPKQVVILHPSALSDLTAAEDRAGLKALRRSFMSHASKRLGFLQHIFYFVGSAKFPLKKRILNLSLGSNVFISLLPENVGSDLYPDGLFSPAQTYNYGVKRFMC